VKQLLRRASYFWAPRVASAARKRWLLWRHPHVDIRFEGPVYLGPGFSLFCPEGGTLVVGPWVEFRRGFRLELHGGEVRIGRGTIFTYDVLMQCTSRITVGERCVFGQASMIVDGNHRFRDLERPVLEQGYDLRPITIGDDVSVMTKCTVIADLGDRVFLGANSVVTKPIAAYTVAAGVPAKVIEELRPSPA
jgi:acetyltransferase-like isoleucine patch superfamily enzyme